MSDFKRERHNPVELIKEFWPDAPVNHITYDPEMLEGEYNVIRQTTSDGTLAFTLEMLQRGLIEIVNMQSLCIPTKPKDWSKVKAIKYTLGKMRHATVFGNVNLPCSSTRKYPGQRERIRMPVKCEYIF